MHVQLSSKDMVLTFGLIIQLNRVKFNNLSQFLSHNFFGLDFHFCVIFSLIGIDQVDYDV